MPFLNSPFTSLDQAIAARLLASFLVDVIQPWWWWLLGISVGVFLLSPVVVVALIVRLPTDFLTAESVPTFRARHPLIGWALKILKNGVGVLLLLAGIVMLVTPGQGLLTMAAGLVLIDGPGKKKFERWLCTRPPVWRSINWIRRKFGRQPLERPPGYDVA